jgi:hypothetical protein
MATHLSEPVEIKVIHRRDNGSGIIEVPILPMAEIDLSKTAGESKGKVAITEAELEEIVANFARFPGPVPIGVQPHQDFGERAGFSPGFINACRVKRKKLYAEVDVTAPLFEEILSGGWRGFSVEIARNLKTATVDLDGWVLTGGVFTNRPATDVNFRIAASEQNTAEDKATYSIRLDKGDKEKEMSQEQIASLEAEVSTQKELVANLRAQADTSAKTAADEIATLETKLTEANKDAATANTAAAEIKVKLAAAADEVRHLTKKLDNEQQTRREAEIKLEAEENRSLREAVVKLAEAAIERGVSAKHFEGLEEDPAAWFNKRYVSLEAMKQFIDALPLVKESAVSSGNKPDEKATISAETAAMLRRIGVDPKFAGVTNENEVLELRAAEKE